MLALKLSYANEIFFSIPLKFTYNYCLFEFFMLVALGESVAFKTLKL